VGCCGFGGGGEGGWYVVVVVVGEGGRGGEERGKGDRITSCDLSSGYPYLTMINWGMGDGSEQSRAE